MSGHSTSGKVSERTKGHTHILRDKTKKIKSNRHTITEKHTIHEKTIRNKHKIDTRNTHVKEIPHSAKKHIPHTANILPQISVNNVRSTSSKFHSEMKKNTKKTSKKTTIHDPKSSTQKTILKPSKNPSVDIPDATSATPIPAISSTPPPPEIKTTTPTSVPGNTSTDIPNTPASLTGLAASDVVNVRKTEPIASAPAQNSIPQQNMTPQVGINSEPHTFNIYSITDNPFAEELPPGIPSITESPKVPPEESLMSVHGSDDNALQQPETLQTTANAEASITESPACTPVSKDSSPMPAVSEQKETPLPSISENPSIDIQEKPPSQPTPVPESLDRIGNPAHSPPKQPQSAPPLTQPITSPSPQKNQTPAMPNKASVESTSPEENRLNLIKFKEQIKMLEESIKSLHEMYQDRVITRSTYEQTKERIEDSITNDRIKVSIEEEKSILEKLKKDLDRDIERSIDTPEFRNDKDTVKHDLERLNKLLEYKVIDEKTYESTKKTIDERMNRINLLINDVNKVVDIDFNRHTQLLLGRMRPDESTPSKDQDDSGSKENKVMPEEQKPVEIKTLPHKNTLVDRVLGIFTVFKKKKKEEATINVSEIKIELDRIKSLESKRDALIELRILLKHEIQKRLLTDKQLTYDQLIAELPKLKADEKLRTDLMAFFKKTSESEYKGIVKDAEFSEMYTIVVDYLKKIEDIAGPHPPQEKKEKTKK